MNGVAKSQGLITQLFFATFMARYYGLSILGDDLLSPMGTIIPSTTYDRMLVEIVSASPQQGRFCVGCVYVCVSMHDKTYALAGIHTEYH